MDHEELKARTETFALDASAFARSLLPSLGTRHAGMQLIRAATSVAANYRASGEARSGDEFIAKLGLVLEEADESLFWLRFLKKSRATATGTLDTLTGDAEQLVRIFGASIRTARRRRTDRHNARSREKPPRPAPRPPSATSNPETRKRDTVATEKVDHD